MFSALLLAGCNTTGTTGKGGSTSSLSVIPNTVSFAKVPVGTTNTQTITVTNTSSSDLTLSQVTVSGTGFTITGLSLPLTLTVGQRTTFNLAFTPASATNFSSNLSFVSNTSDSPAVIAVAGTGVHAVTLNWTASTSVVAGYNVYRSSQAGGPYARLNSSLILTTNYTDNTVQSGRTYYFVTTAVDPSNLESPYSNQVSATIPSP